MTIEKKPRSESTEELKLSDDLFPNYSVVLKEYLDEKDQLIIKYLSILDEYTQATEQIQNEFKEGFINLSRANYANSSFVKPFGKDCWDNTVKAIKKIRIGDTYTLIDLNEEDGKEETNEEESTIRNRNKKDMKEKDANSVAPKRKYNPINMFGGLVPYQLRQSQQHFTKSLPHIINMINLRNQLVLLESELKKSSSVESKIESETPKTT